MDQLELTQFHTMVTRAVLRGYFTSQDRTLSMGTRFNEAVCLNDVPSAVLILEALERAALRDAGVR